MSNLLERKCIGKVLRLTEIFPAVIILGSRQCGKSTLIKMMADKFKNLIYIDLQDRRDMMKLTDPMLFFEANANATICLDEVQLKPELFSALRSEIDRFRKPGRFILLGSASEKLLHQSSETLAGRAGLIDLTPFTIQEAEKAESYSISDYWFRGGYPDSFLASDDEASKLWRENFIRTYIERDIPQLSYQIAAPKMMTLLTMLSHEHGGMLNTAKLASAMGMTAPTIRHYIDIMEQTYIVRTLQPYFKNTKKRLVKTPKVYIRDSGLLHQILQIQSFNDLLGNPNIGMSWEGIVVENVCSTVSNAKCSFYRRADGKEEMDLVVEKGDKTIAIECKSSTAPQVTEGFWKSIETLEPAHSYIVAPIKGKYSIHNGVDVIGLAELLTELNEEILV